MMNVEADVEKLKQELEATKRQLTKLTGSVSERLKVEASLLESGAFNFSLLENSPNPIIVMNPDSAIRYVSPSLERLTGYTAAELIGQKDPHPWWVEGGKQQTITSLRDKIALGAPAEEELFQKKNGERFWVSSNAVPVEHDGELAYIVVNWTVITERKQMEAALRESEAFKTSLLDNSPYPIIVTNPDSSIRYVNPALEKLTGFTLEEVVGQKTPRPWWVEGVTQGVLNKLKDRLPNGGQASDEILLQKKNGDYFWININTALIERDGELLYVLVTWLDITERKLAEEALKKNQTRLSTAMEIAKLGYWEFDLDERVFVFNDQFYSIFKTSAEKVGGYKMSPERYRELFIHPDDRYIMNGEIENSFDNADPPLQNQLEHRILYADGGVGYISVRSYAETDREGKIIRVYGANQDITEHKQAEKALRESDERLAMAVEGTNLGLWDWMVQTGETVFNERWANIAGYTLEELSPVSIETWARLAHPDDLKRSNELLAKHFAGESEFYECEARMKHKNGDWVWVLDRGRAIEWDDAGKPVRAIGTHLDITELKKAEEKHHTVINTAQDGFFIVNTEGRLVEVNDSYCKMIGYSQEELLTMSVIDIEASESPEETSEHLKNMVKQGPELFETRHRRKDGEVIDVEVSINYLDMEEGQIFAFLRNITERKKADELFRALANSSPIGIYIVQDGKFRYVNPRLQEQMGYAENELLGRDSLSIVSSEDRERVRNNSINMLKGKSTAPYEYRVINRAGDTIWVIETVAPITYRGRRAIVGNQIDITERKRLEEEQQKVEKLKSIGTLAGGIAHDFNNILTGIMGNISLAQRQVEPDSKISERLEEAEKASLRAKDLTHRLLTFARGGAPIKKTVSVAELVRDAANFAMRGSNVSCEYSFPDDLWALDADEGQLNQVFTNLVINAVEAMPMGGILNISARNLLNKKEEEFHLPKGNFVETTVADRGTGMSKAHLEKIFEPYFTTKQRGSGLGLATTYSIIKNHEGYITVDSELGVGTTFRVYLPASNTPAPAPVPVPRELPTNGSGRILVMDDEDTIRLLLSRILNKAGYEVELSRDGEETIRKYTTAREAGKPFAAVIMDLTIPGGMGGRESINKLLEIDPEAKVIVSSGYSTDPIMADYQSYGFKGVVAKPYKVGDVEKTLRNVLLDQQ